MGQGTVRRPYFAQRAGLDPRTLGVPDLTAWEAHLRRWPPVEATAVATLGLLAAAHDMTDVARHLADRFPGAFELLGITPPPKDQ